MSMKLFNHIAGMDTPLLSSYDRAVLLTIAVRCDDEGHMLCTSKAMAFALRMDKGNFSRKIKEFVTKGVLAKVAKVDGGFVVSQTIVNGAKLSDGQSSPVVGGTTPAVSTTTLFPPHPLTPDKNIKNNNQDYSIDPPIIPPNKTNSTTTCMGQNPNVTVVRPNYWEQRANRKPWREYIEEQRQAYLASKPQYTKEQEAFLEAYPKAPGSPAAFVLAWEEVIKQDVLPQELINAARIASNSPAFKENGGQYIPKPENWLAGKGWAQTVEPWKAKRKQQAIQEDANQPPPDLDFDPFCKDLQDVVAITSDMPVPFKVRDTSDWEPSESEIIRLRAVSAIKKWVTARNNKQARTKQPLIDAAREVLNFFLIQERTGEKPYIPSNRIAWLNTNIIRVSPEEILTPEQAICLARQDFNR